MTGARASEGMAKLISHREEIVPIKSETYAPPVIPREEAAPSAGPALPPRMRPREPETVQAPPSDRHCPRCNQSATYYFDLFQLRPSAVNPEQAQRQGVDAHPWVMAVFCGQCRTYLSFLPVAPKAAPTLPFTHG